MTVKNVIIYQGTQAMPGVLRLPDRSDPAPAVVFSNGYCAYMEMYDEMAQAFCEAGYVTLQYEPRGSRGSEFGHLLCGTGWLEDCCAAISFVWAQPEVDKNRIGLAGVSMGGATTVRQGAVDPRIKALLAMAPVDSWADIMEHFWTITRGKEAYDAWKQEMYEDAARAATGFPSRFVSGGYGCRGVANDPEAAAAELAAHPYKIQDLPIASVFNSFLYVNAAESAKSVRKPLCVIHGTADPVCPQSCGQRIYDNAPTEDKAIHFIEGAGHVLPEECPANCIRIGLDWFNRYL